MNSHKINFSRGERAMDACINESGVSYVFNKSMNFVTEYMVN